MISEKVKELFDKLPFMALSTVDSNGMPNTVVIGSKKIVDSNTVWTIDTFHNKTKENILNNGNVSIALWKGKEGYQIKGKAKYYSEGDVFEKGKNWILKYKPTKIVKGVIEIKITEVFSLSPNYNEAGKKIA
ncbi:MAG: pyridoxamine 5'-phosphate oxidase family protein [Bacteroidota bacterium]|nr:pyridoxamine 5'-phosphate oxidase family protein [Bacteroidota bacterium]